MDINFVDICRAAELEKNVVHQKGIAAEEDDDDYQVISMPSQLANPLSIGSGLTFSDDEEEEEANEPTNPNSDNQSNENNSSDHEVIAEPSDDESINEIVIKVGGEESEESKEKGIYRQPSTTEYLSGMVHTLSPVGLLPQFPSWSLVCVGHSSVYSHNSGSKYFDNCIDQRIKFEDISHLILCFLIKFLNTLKVDFCREPIFYSLGMYKFVWKMPLHGHELLTKHVIAGNHNQFQKLIQMVKCLC